MASDEPLVSPDEPHLSPHEIEQLERTLSEFKRSLQLPQGDPGRTLADQNMRRIGFSVPQIITLSGEHHLPESTIKNHVKGITASSDAPAQKAVQFIAGALDENVTLQTIRDFIEVKISADASKVTMKDIIVLLQALNAQKIPFNDFINDYKQMKDLGLTPANLKSFLDYKTRLEKTGFSLNQLKLVYDTAVGYGEPEKVLKAIGSYNDLQHLENQIRTTKAEQKKLDDLLEADRKEKATLERDTKDLKDEIESHKPTLARVKRLNDLGYDDTILNDLATSTGSLGGVQQVVTSLGKLHDVNELQLTISELKKTKTQLEQEKTSVETANAHLKAHIDATTQLIEEHKLGLDAISALLRIARKHGTAPQVLKAFETYDSIEQLRKEEKKTEDDIEKTKASLNELTHQEKELRDKVAELLPKIETDVKKWIKDLNEKFDAATISVTSTLKSQNETFKKDFADSIKDANDLKIKLDGDFKTINENAETEIKTLTNQMKTNVESSKNEFVVAFDKSKRDILSELKSLLDAAHELDKAYNERQAEVPKLTKFLQLIDLVDDPRSVTDIRFLATIQLTLRKTAQWINLNPSKFGYHPSASDLSYSIEELDKKLSKVSFEPSAIT